MATVPTQFKTLAAGAAGGAPRLFERPPIFGYDLNVESISSETTGGVLATAYPSAKLMTSYTVQNDIGLVGLVFATSILQPVAAKLCGLFVIIGDKPDTIAINKAAKMPLLHLTYQNSPAAGTPNPMNKTSSLSFGENSAMRVNSGQSISIYGTGDNIAQTMAAILTIFTIALDKR